MSANTLQDTTLKTVANYRRTALAAVGAYRNGSLRLINGLQKRVDRAADDGERRGAPTLSKSLRSNTYRVTGMAVQGVERLSGGAERVIDKGADGLLRRVDRVAEMVDGVQSPRVARGLNSVARISMPGARVALTVSQALADSAQHLARLAAGREDAMNATEKVIKRWQTAGDAVSAEVVKTTKRSRQAVVEAVEPVVAEVEAVARTAQRKARSAADKVKASAKSAVRSAAHSVAETAEAVEAAVTEATETPAA